ncbi:MAG TPA: Hpt domain-containing protein [Bacillota bacterium]|nr:Hpt domain-containing protein [Bacillota bacterium]
MNKAILIEHGINYDSGLRRFLDDTELYEKMLEAFLSDDSYKKILKAYSENNMKSLFDDVHTLKGTSGSLDLERLYKASCALSDYLKFNSTPDKGLVNAMYLQLQKAYDFTVEGIRLAL